MGTANVNEGCPSISMKIIEPPEMALRNAHDPWGQACQHHCTHLTPLSGEWIMHEGVDKTDKAFVHLFHKECFEDASRANGGYCPQCSLKEGRVDYKSYLVEDEAKAFLDEIADYSQVLKGYITEQRATILSGFKKLSYLSMPVIALAIRREHLWASAAVAALGSGVLGYCLTKSESDEEKRSVKYGIAFRHGVSLPMAAARNAMIIAGVASILANLWYPHTPKIPLLNEGLCALAVRLVFEDVMKTVYTISDWRKNKDVNAQGMKIA